MKDRKIDGLELRNLALGFIVFLVMSAYYLIIFKYTWMVARPYSFYISKDFGMAPGKGVELEHFGFTELLLIAGLIISLAQILMYEKDRNRFFDKNMGKISAAAIGSIYLLLIGYTNYVGFDERAWQIRTVWPVYLAPFFGMGLYFIGSKAELKLKHFLTASFFLLAIFGYMHYGKLPVQGVMDKPTYDAFMWIRDNTPKDAKVFHFYAPASLHPASIWLTKRNAYKINFDDFVDGLRKGIIKEEYKVDAITDYGGLPYRKSFFSFGYRASEGIQVPDFGEMEYYVFYTSFVNADPYLVQYNKAIRDLFLKNGYKEVYNNDFVSILKNTKPGVKLLG